MALKNQNDYVLVGRVDAFSSAVDNNPLTSSSTITVQPGVVFRIARFQLDIVTPEGAAVAGATAQVNDANGTIYLELVGSGNGSYVLDAETGDPIGNRIGPFTTATVVRCALINKTAVGGSFSGTCHATLEREVPSPSNTTIV